jgi:hypothetical protein
MKIVNLFKTKKAFLLPLIIPVIVLIFAFSNYNNNPVVCGNSFTESTKCNNFVEFLSDPYGFVWSGLAMLGFVISLLIILSIYFILNGKKKIGYAFLGLFVLWLFFMFSRFIFFLF